MRAFKLLVNDDRPGLSDYRWVTARNEIRAREIAEQAFRESPHHVGVELWEADELMFVVGKRLVRGIRPVDGSR